MTTPWHWHNIIINSKIKKKKLYNMSELEIRIHNNPSLFRRRRTHTNFMNTNLRMNINTNLLIYRRKKSKLFWLCFWICVFHFCAILNKYSHSRPSTAVQALVAVMRNVKQKRQKILQSKFCLVASFPFTLVSTSTISK